MKSPKMSPYQEYIAYSRYARWMPEMSRRENWDETVHRYISFFSNRIPKSDREAITHELEEAILHMEVMPSMRAMMTAGEALEKDHTAGYNCFLGTETFLTKEGVKSFLETVGTVQTVLSQKGEWVPASIQSFGVQSLNEITLKPSCNKDGRTKTNLRLKLTATPNHRWLTLNRGETTDLQLGDLLPFVGAPKSTFNPEAWIMGFGFGDGTIDSRGCATVRLCGEKNRRWLGVFENYGHSSICHPPSYNGDAAVIFHQGWMNQWKQLPPLDKGVEYLANWLEGYLAADDGHDDPHQPGISSQNLRAIEFVKVIAALAGYIVTGQNTCSIEETNLGRSSPLQRLTLRRSGLFKVQSIEPLDTPEEVFCVVEPTTHAFVLGSGVLTGNCSYIAVDDPRAFDEAMYISMCGTGVGFSVERQYVSQLPYVAEAFYLCDTVIKVKDSKIGWANAFRQLIALLYGGSIPKWDMSGVRPAGSPLKTFGGRASGPEPLECLFKFAIRLFQNAAGRKLTSIECHDLMCMVADIVVSGGVRRSAMISLSNLSDDRMRNAKNGQWWIENDQRRLANNSVAYTEKPDIGIFMKEWMTLYESRSGERGIFNREGARKHAAKNGRRKWEGIELGTNPCVSKRSIIHTTKGAKTAADLIGVPFTAIVDGEEHPSTDKGFYVTGVMPLFRIKTNRGYELEATDNHKILVIDHLSRKLRRTTWKTVAELVPGDLVVLNNHRGSSFSGEGSFEEGWLLGNLKGDGNIEKGANLDYWGDNRSELVTHAVSSIHATVGGRSDLQGCDQPQYNRSRAGSVKLGKLSAKFGFTRDKRIDLAVESASSEFHKGFLRGWFDADGSVQGTQNKGVSVRLSSSDMAGLKAAQRMLLRLGIASTIYPCRRDAGMRSLPDGHLGYKEYGCEAQHELVVANDNLIEFASVVGFEDTSKQDRLMSLLTSYKRSLNVERFYTEVTSILPIGEEEVLDCTIPTISAFDANGIYVHNCGEILLRPKGFCNLTEVVVRPDDTKTSLKKKIRKATILGTLQSTLVDFRYLRKEWQKNAEEERLLGVSLTGIMDNKIMATNGTELAKLLDELREYAIEINKEWAEKLGINVSAAITCIKPSGTVSQLVDSSSGIHTRYAKYIERAVREDKKNPIGNLLRDAGVKCEPDVTKPNDVDVFYFPLESPAESACRNDLNAIQQLELYLTYKLHWTEHNPSCTIYIREHEWLEVATWVYKHFDAIGGVSFLPHADNGHIYKQAPYTEITKEEYTALLSKSPQVIDWARLSEFEKEDQTTGMKELACSGNTCELVL